MFEISSWSDERIVVWLARNDRMMVYDRHLQSRQDHSSEDIRISSGILAFVVMKTAAFTACPWKQHEALHVY